MQAASACNIPEKELMVRMAILKANQTKLDQQHLVGQLRDDFEESNISKKEFNKILDTVKKVYAPIFKSQRMNFRIESQWEDKQVNAFAGTRGTDRYILLYGGYARHKLMTKDAYLSVVCHEIGHHLGGFPKKNAHTWSSSEGQADYFSTLKCMKEVLRVDENNKEIALALDLPDEVKKQCRFQYPNANDYFICLRSSKAAEEHGKVIGDLDSKGASSDVSLMTPSTDVVSDSNLKHPDAQCRVDTKFQGALCNVSTKIALDDLDESIGTCTFNNFNILGNRPDCWFVHKK
jgi:hypothetical protein